ncbi:DNA-binding protein [Ferribacterium limneticum]|uniref:DNA-binding protein n=1 Tax=Ferribacterium limneticum TaxID=76259 RepID=UPI001CF91133|nr:DNA-binding protein [Ferribacterium limneticum]UCV26776.1 DNA-binding protein [Ferribacterium limneticum]UCV30693.1 DNA-binding protein [Ferribacterium limneticum]
MAITVQDVVNAAAELQSQGLTPSVRKVRKLLGSGDPATISKYLKPLLTPRAANPSSAVVEAAELLTETFAQARSQLSEVKQLLAQLTVQAPTPTQNQVSTPVQAQFSLTEEEAKQFQELLWKPEAESLAELFSALLEEACSLNRKLVAQYTLEDALKEQLLEAQLVKASQPDARSNKLELDLLEAQQQVKSLQQRCESAEESRDNLARKLYGE